MQKWEYRMDMFDHWLSEEDLQHFGNEGWELVTVLCPEPGKAVYIYYFKRPKQ